MELQWVGITALVGLGCFVCFMLGAVLGSAGARQRAKSEQPKRCKHFWQLRHVERGSMAKGSQQMPVSLLSYQCKHDPTHWQQVTLAGETLFMDHNSDVPDSFKQAWNGEDSWPTS